MVSASSSGSAKTRSVSFGNTKAARRLLSCRGLQDQVGCRMLIQKRPPGPRRIRDANCVRSAADFCGIAAGCGSAGIAKRWPAYEALDGFGHDLSGQHGHDELPRVGVVRLDRTFGDLQVCDVPGSDGDRMSYARFGEGDVYVIGSGDGLECLNCSLMKGRIAFCATPQEMLRHLVEHKKLGHKVPSRALTRLHKEITETPDA